MTITTITSIIFFTVLILFLAFVTYRLLENKFDSINIKTNDRITHIQSILLKLRQYLNLDNDSFSILQEAISYNPSTNVVTDSVLIDRLISAYETESLIDDTNVRIVKYDYVFSPIIEIYNTNKVKLFADNDYWKIIEVQYEDSKIKVTFVKQQQLK